MRSNWMWKSQENSEKGNQLHFVFERFLLYFILPFISYGFAFSPFAKNNISLKYWRYSKTNCIFHISLIFIKIYSKRRKFFLNFSRLCNVSAKYDLWFILSIHTSAHPHSNPSPLWKELNEWWVIVMVMKGLSSLFNWWCSNRFPFLHLLLLFISFNFPIAKLTYFHPTMYQIIIQNSFKCDTIM